MATRVLSRHDLRLEHIFHKQLLCKVNCDTLLLHRAFKQSELKKSVTTKCFTYISLILDAFIQTLIFVLHLDNLLCMYVQQC